MRCLVCKSGEMVESRTTYFAQLNSCYVIIENVPCRTCGQCGETVFSASVLETIDDILERAESIASKIVVTDYLKAA